MSERIIEFLLTFSVYYNPLESFLLAYSIGGATRIRSTVGLRYVFYLKLLIVMCKVVLRVFAQQHAVLE